MNIIKNKINKRKFEFTVIFLILLFIAMMKIVTLTASPVSAEDISSVPSLFYDDYSYLNSMPGSSPYMPLERIDGIFYVPVYIFKSLNCKMESLDNYKDKFYIQYGSNYIVFNVSAGKTEKETDGLKNDVSCKVEFIRGITYVPAEVVANALGLKWEYNEQYNTFRITGIGAKRTFAEILAPHIKKIQTAAPPETAPPTSRHAVMPPVSTTVPPIDKPEITTSPYQITPPVTTGPREVTTPQVNPLPTTTSPAEPETEPTTAENTREIENYLMFYESESVIENENGNPDKDDRADKIDEVLEILNKNAMKAVFFLSRSEIAENPNILRTIYTSGHGLGIKFESGKANFETEDLISELETANDLIYSVIKHKTRFCVFDESIEIPESSGTFGSYENKLSEKGYYLCEKTVDIFDLSNIGNSNEMIDFIKQESINVFMFDLNGNYKNYIELSAQAVEIKFYINFSYINNATNIENIKKIKNRTAAEK